MGKRARWTVIGYGKLRDFIDVEKGRGIVGEWCDGAAGRWAGVGRENGGEVRVRFGWIARGTSSILVTLSMRHCSRHKSDFSA